MPLLKLQQFLQTIEPAVYLVEPLVLRRVVRLDRRLQGLRFVIPHDFSYTIDRDRLLAFVELDELAIPPGSDLPRRVILLAQPDEDELEDVPNWNTLEERYCRLLFHANVHLSLDNLVAKNPDSHVWAALRIEQIGQVEFAEIREVLLKENLLFQSPSDTETYIEFAALALELKYYSPHELPIFFPGIRNWGALEQILSQDLNHTRLSLRFLQLGRRHSDANLLLNAAHDQTATAQASPQRTQLSLGVFRQFQSKAVSTAALGNGVKAALDYLRLAKRAPADYEREVLAAAEAELVRFATRLQGVFQLTDEQRDQWRDALRPLLAPAANGFWSTEARLLYDLQKVCSEQERGVYRLDLMEWIRSFGARPVRRPLPLMQDALSLRHLRTAQRRIAASRITPAEQSRLLHLIEQELPRIEHRSRDRVRIIILKVFDDVGFVPRNVLEVVARKKLVEELLDRIVEKSYFTLGDLRDAISKNDLKLPDVTKLSELAFGDCMLRADKKFDVLLDGIYRRGAMYLRWPQTLSSLVFGTNSGRFLTRHVFIPFGGAYLVIEFVHHVLVMLSGDDAHGHSASHEVIEEVSRSAMDYIPLFSGVLLLGTWMSLMIHRPDFRAWNLGVITRSWRFLRNVLVDLPSDLLHSPSVQQILASRTFAVVRSYLIEPAILVGLVSLYSFITNDPWSLRSLIDLYLVTALFLNSPVGRYVSERTVDFLVRAYQEIKMHVFAAIVQWVMDLFDWIFIALERVVYTVDEWLRFRTGDDRALRWIKLAGGVVWFFVSYVVVFIFTLLVEPQINPIKHFPVVTVSHKLILPAFPEFVRRLTPYLGRKSAQTVVWTTIWLIPGVFGFLVWELKENWRLYAANRPKKIGAEAIGHHGETMLRLLRPGFHSGTLPKLFAALRRFVRKGNAADETRIQRKKSGILHVEESVHHFVDRELVALLEEVGFLPETKLRVTHVHAATNRIDAMLIREDLPDQPAVLTWEYYDGRLTGAINPAGWMDHLSSEDGRILIAGLEGLFQLSGVEAVDSPFLISVSPPIVWTEAVESWTYEKQAGMHDDVNSRQEISPSRSV